jgi:hypothetical protein
VQPLGARLALPSAPFPITVHCGPIAGLTTAMQKTRDAGHNSAYMNNVANTNWAPTVVEALAIPSPKRRARRERPQEFYPYYAGFPESFARAMLSSSLISPGSLIYDPWNGSGTTTSVASRLGLPAIGFDLNPVMVIVAKARLLPANEAPSLVPLARAIVTRARAKRFHLSSDEQLSTWFKPRTASVLRSIERSCAELLIDAPSHRNLDHISSIAATFYTALFYTGRRMASAFRTANPTWLRFPKSLKERVRFPCQEIENNFLNAVNAMSKFSCRKEAEPFQRVACQVNMADATTVAPTQIVDCVLTSPPYCTRIDYTVGTRIELALLDSLIEIDAEDLRRRMTGTTVVPAEVTVPLAEWGPKCNHLLRAVHSHPSKASKGYYYLTHVDYFHKIFQSLTKLSGALRQDGNAFFIVQDSFYKDLHNDLPGILTEMADGQRLHLRHRADFNSPTCMSRINTRAVAHGMRKGSTESVLCFQKQ